VLALFVGQTLLGPTLRHLLAGPGVAGRIRIALGSRDDPRPETAWSTRATRPLANL
jgi:hypothetical protein